MRNLLITSLLLIMAAGCKKDNYEKPASTLTGRVVYEKSPVGVRSNAVQLELWQHGYANFSRIPVYVSQEGDFSAKLFDGEYKLVLRQGNGPWLDNADSLDVSVHGSTNIDVHVNPYFILTGTSFVRNGDQLTVTTTITQVHDNLPLEAVRLYIGKTNIVDQVNKVADVTAAVDISQPVSLTITLPEKTTYYARIGVKIAGVAEQVYSTVQKAE
jgi:hypothetical protein